MTKQEALQLFASHVDVPALKADFPDLDYIITELEDGQQEIIIRLQGEDPDFRPNADIAVINAMTVDDLLEGKVKNEIVLRKHKRKMIRARKHRRDIALVKRTEVMLAPAGVPLRRFTKVLKNRIAVEEIEL